LPEFNVRSPSFLHMLYYGEDFAHLDAYTLISTRQLLSLDLSATLQTRCLIIEWGELIKDIISQYNAKILQAKIQYSSMKKREITLEI
jgi:tRNA A37 threonylcarbamoyladenosine biosynthesis protein TsaE